MLRAGQAVQGLREETYDRVRLTWLPAEYNVGIASAVHTSVVPCQINTTKYDFQPCLL
jgi:hypothetical protein